MPDETGTWQALCTHHFPRATKKHNIELIALLSWPILGIICGQEARGAAAASRALRLPEILQAIFEKLQLIEDGDHVGVAAILGNREDDAGDDADWNESTALADTASLFSTALVNWTWFAAAVPFLWKRPSEEAFRADSIVSPAQRAFYAAHIQEMHLTGRCPLWAALVGSRARCGKLASTSVGAGRSNNAQGPEAAYDLRLPRLRKLFVSRDWRFVLAPEPLSVALDQAPLLRYVSADAEAVACHVSDDVVELVEALHNDEPLRPVRLRSLQLFVSRYAAVHVAATAMRLLAFIAGELRACRFLTTIRSPTIIVGIEPDVMDSAFEVFAQYGGLNTLMLGDDNDRSGAWVSAKAIAKVVAALHSPTLAPTDECGRCEQQHQQPQSRRRPFAELNELRIAVHSSAMATLAQLLTSVTRLSVDMGGWDDASTPSPASFTRWRRFRSCGGCTSSCATTRPFFRPTCARWAAWRSCAGSSWVAAERAASAATTWRRCWAAWRRRVC
jgi:hypothetical protein